MHKKLKILVSAYACSPNRGSEPGMGWNFVLGLAEFHEVHVISEKLKWEKPVTAFLKENPELAHRLKFYFIEKKRNKPLRKICPPSYYWYYRHWQQKAFRLARELDEVENFDIVHQLNMVGYREPGYLWKLQKPFVWGPIGGLDNSPWRFLPSLGFKGMIFYAGRNLINLWQRNFKLRPRKAASHPNSRLIAATPSNANFIKKRWKRDAQIITEVGQEATDNVHISSRSKNEPLKIFFSGLHIPGKNLPLLLRALKTAQFPFELHILGKGEMTKKWKRIANKYGIQNSCIWHGWLEKEKAISTMQQGHVFCITSISDLTSTVTLEALSYGLPVVCLDHCGFAHVVNESCGIKIPVDTPTKAAHNFAIALEKLFNNEEYRQELSRGAINRAADFSWDKKIEQLNSIYSELLKKDKTN